MFVPKAQYIEEKKTKPKSKNVKEIKNKRKKNTPTKDNRFEKRIIKKIKLTFSRVSSMASSLNFSLPPFFSILSQKVASSSALELPATPLLQKISKASLSACSEISNWGHDSKACSDYKLRYWPCEIRSGSESSQSHRPYTYHAVQ